MNMHFSESEIDIMDLDNVNSLTLEPTYKTIKEIYFQREIIGKIIYGSYYEFNDEEHFEMSVEDYGRMSEIDMPFLYERVKDYCREIY